MVDRLFCIQSSIAFFNFYIRVINEYINIILV